MSECSIREAECTESKREARPACSENFSFVYVITEHTRIPIPSVCDSQFYANAIRYRCVRVRLCARDAMIICALGKVMRVNAERVRRSKITTMLFVHTHISMK